MTAGGGRGRKLGSAVHRELGPPQAAGAGGQLSSLGFWGGVGEAVGLGRGSLCAAGPRPVLAKGSAGPSSVQGAEDKAPDSTAGPGCPTCRPSWLRSCRRSRNCIVSREERLGRGSPALSPGPQAPASWDALLGAGLWGHVERRERGSGVTLRCEGSDLTAHRESESRDYPGSQPLTLQIWFCVEPWLPHPGTGPHVPGGGAAQLGP